MVVVVLLLGPNDEYLDFRKFESEELADKFVESIHELMLANIRHELPLKERLKLAPEYFPFAGRVESFDTIIID